MLMTWMKKLGIALTGMALGAIMVATTAHAESVDAVIGRLDGANQTGSIKYGEYLELRDMLRKAKQAYNIGMPHRYEKYTTRYNNTLASSTTLDAATITTLTGDFDPMSAPTTP